MLLNVLGYILGIGFVIFGICSIYYAGYELYKIISKSDKKLSFNKAIIFGILSLVCAIILIIIANTL